MAPPQRQKNLRVHESVNSDQAALRNIIVNDDTSDEKELKFLQLLKAKVDLNILTQDDVTELVVKDDPVETLTLKILKRLNKMSTYDPSFQQLCSVMGSNSRQEIAKKLASRYVASAALKRVIRYTVGREDLNSIGEAELAADLQKSEAITFGNPMAQAGDQLQEEGP